MDTTEDTGDPVFKAELPSGSYAHFLFPDNGYIRIHHIASLEQGDMKRLLNYITQHFSMNKLEFFNVLDEEVDMTKVVRRMSDMMGEDIDVEENDTIGGNLEDRLHGFRRIEVPMSDGSELVVLRGKWKPKEHQKNMTEPYEMDLTEEEETILKLALHNADEAHEDYVDHRSITLTEDNLQTVMEALMEETVTSMGRGHEEGDLAEYDVVETCQSLSERVHHEFHYGENWEETVDNSGSR